VPTPPKLQDTLIGYPVLPNQQVNTLTNNSNDNIITITVVITPFDIVMPVVTSGLQKDFNRSEM
jgi:hypothetical protein